MFLIWKRSAYQIVLMTGNRDLSVHVASVLFWLIPDETELNRGREEGNPQPPNFPLPSKPNNR